MSSNDDSLVLTDCKLIVVHVNILRLDVLDNHLVGDITRTRRKIPSPPEMTTPKLTGNRFELVHHAPAALSLDFLDQVADRHVRRNRNEQMDMILRDVSPDDLNIHLVANVPDQLPDPTRQLSRHHWLAVLRDPNEMDLEIINAVRGLSVVLHPPKLIKLKSSPEGEGFSPNPRMGH